MLKYLYRYILVLADAAPQFPLNLMSPGFTQTIASAIQSLTEGKPLVVDIVTNQGSLNFAMNNRFSSEKDQDQTIVVDLSGDSPNVVTVKDPMKQNNHNYQHTSQYGRPNNPLYNQNNPLYNRPNTGFNNPYGIPVHTQFNRPNSGSYNPYGIPTNSQYNRPNGPLQRPSNEYPFGRPPPNGGTQQFYVVQEKPQNGNSNYQLEVFQRPNTGNENNQQVFVRPDGSQYVLHSNGDSNGRPIQPTTTTTTTESPHSHQLHTQGLRVNPHYNEDGEPTKNIIGYLNDFPVILLTRNEIK